LSPPIFAIKKTANEAEAKKEYRNGTYASILCPGFVELGVPIVTAQIGTIQSTASPGA
jgi:hypothetical protein